MGEHEDREAALWAWAEKDAQRAVLPADRAIIESAASLRGLVLDAVRTGRDADELYDACSLLGRAIAQHGGSPTFASATLDGVAEVIAETAGTAARGGAWLVPARAALVEGFAATLAEAARREVARAWEYPACAVALGEAGVAIAAGYPPDDDEDLSAWAARVAKAAALSGVRRAVVAGSRPACAALLDAMGLVGIEAHVAPRPLSR
jgi:hypothetical protein